MKFFKVSSEIREAGSIWDPNAKYDDCFNGYLSEEKRQIEEALNMQSKYGKRSDYLFIFNSLEAALLFLIRCLKGGRIYSVTINPEDIVARCDMNLVECMMCLLNYRTDEQKQKSRPEGFGSIAKAYWESGKTFIPCWEYLVKKATTQKCIFQVNNQQHSLLCKEYQDEGCTILEMPTFKKLYMEIYLSK